MGRETFWQIAKRALTDVLTECGRESEIDTAHGNMFWVSPEDSSDFGILFVGGPGGMFPVYISNKLSEEETKQEFKRELLLRIAA